MSYPYLAIHEKKSLSNVQTNKHQVIYSRTNYTRRNRRRDSDPSRDVVVTVIVVVIVGIGPKLFNFLSRELRTLPSIGIAKNDYTYICLSYRPNRRPVSY